MTKLWGPLGWITLHSISVCYPDNPTDADKRILEEFMNAFGSTLACVYCRQHFARMFQDYKNKHPEWKQSRHNLFLAIARMHNSVNKRLEKPYPKTVGESLDMLVRATAYTTPLAFRAKYIEYLLKDWGRQRGTGQGYGAYQSVLVMQKIINEYWNPRDVLFQNVELAEGDLLDYVKNVVSQRPSIPKFNLRSLLGKRS